MGITIAGCCKRLHRRQPKHYDSILTTTKQCQSVVICELFCLRAVTVHPLSRLTFGICYCHIEKMVTTTTTTATTTAAVAAATAATADY